MVVVDLNMPLLHGFGFLTKVRKIPGCAEVPVIVLSGRELSANDRKRLRGASQILKPGDLASASLAERLRHLPA